MFRVSQRPSSGVLKTVPAASGTGHTTCRVETESGGTRRRTGGEVKGKEANGEGSQQFQLDSEQSIQCYYNRSPSTRTARKPVLD